MNIVLGCSEERIAWSEDRHEVVRDDEYGPNESVDSVGPSRNQEEHDKLLSQFVDKDALPDDVKAKEYEFDPDRPVVKIRFLCIFDSGLECDQVGEVLKISFSTSPNQ